MAFDDFLTDSQSNTGTGILLTAMQALEKSGYHVLDCRDGVEALQLLEDSGPAIIVLDYQMPELNGAQICELVRQSSDPAIAGIPILLLTAHSNAEHEVECLRAGANDFVTKPEQAVELMDAVGSPQVGWHFDIGNSLRYSPPETWIPVLGKRILKLHIKEFNKKKAEAEGRRNGFSWKLGDPDGIDWPAVVKALADIGYKGTATVELEGGDPAYLHEACRRLKLILSGDLPSGKKPSA